MKFFDKIYYYISSIFKLLFNIKNLYNLFLIFIIKRKNEEYLIELREPAVKFFVRTPMDVWSIKETFLDKFYLRYGVPVKDGWTVIDVGAGLGDFSIIAALGNPDTVVYAFEPYLNSYIILNRNLKNNDIKNVFTFQKAIWWEDCQLKLDLSRGDPLKISSHEVVKKISHSDTEIVSAISLEEFFKINDIINIDLMKMDCEGAEYEILLNSKNEILRKIKRIILEYHEFDDNQEHFRLEKFLRCNGYQVVSFPNYVHKNIGYLYAEHESK